MNQWNISSLRDLLIPLKPATRERKQLSKWPGKAVCSAVSSRVRRSFRENFSSEGRKENICHVWYFLPRKADFSPCPVNVWIGLNQINQIANEIGLLAHVISKLKMAKIFKFWFKMADEDRQRDKMALTALLVALLVRKIRRRRSRRRKTWAAENEFWEVSNKGHTQIFYVKTTMHSYNSIDWIKSRLK